VGSLNLAGFINTFFRVSGVSGLPCIDSLQKEQNKNIMDLPASLANTLMRPPATSNGPTATFPFGLGASGVHELAEASFGDMAALTGFALAAAPRKAKGAVFWITQNRLSLEHGHLLQGGANLYRPACPAYVSVYPRQLCDALWIIEEAVRSSAVSLVVAEIEDADFTASRRLALASGRHGVPVILLMPYTRQGATAASARWRVGPRPSARNLFDPHAPGHARWHVELERSRQVPHLAGRCFDVSFNDETLSLSMAPGLAAGSAAPHAPSHEIRDGQTTRRSA
jgi:protein ImuA